MTTPNEIDALRALPSESPRLEFKAARQDFSFERLCEYCVAIANEGGGQLVLGVADKAPRPVVGTQAFPNPDKTALSVRQKLGFHIDIEAVAHFDGRIVVVRVPPRPRGTAYQLEGRYLCRSGEALVSMTEDRLRMIFDEGKPDWLEEVARARMTSQEVMDTLDTQSFFELLNHTDRD